MALPQEKITRNGDAQGVRYAPVNPEREYVAGQNGFFSNRIGQVLLSLFNDDAELVAGADVYERMRTDPEIAKCLRVLKDGVTSGGYSLIPAITDKPKQGEVDPDYDKAQEALAICRSAVSSDNLPTPFVQTLDEMVDAALVHGHKIAEKTYKYIAGETGGAQLTLSSVKVKPRGAINFVVDEFMNVLGFSAARIVRRPDDEQISAQDIIPREKFFVLTFNRRDEDPRGRSSLRPVYNVWQAKRAGLPIYLKWMEKSAIPSVWGTTAEKEPLTVQEYDSAGTPTGRVRSSAEEMAAQLANLENASAGASPFSSTVKQLSVLGDGSQFTRFNEFCDSQISMALLLQTLATREGSRGNGSRAASQTHLQVMELLIWHLKAVVCDAVRSDVFTDLVRYNLGEEYVRLTPTLSLGKSDRDWTPQEAAAIAADLTDSQWNYVTGGMSIPAPLEEESLPSRTKAMGAGATGGNAGADLTGVNG